MRFAGKKAILPGGAQPFLLMSHALDYVTLECNETWKILCHIDRPHCLRIPFALALEIPLTARVLLDFFAYEITAEACII